MKYWRHGLAIFGGAVIAALTGAVFYVASLGPVPRGERLDYSHVVLDRIMHSDIRPLAPFSDANPLLHIVELDTLHLACVGAGLIAVLVIIFRSIRANRRRP